jgi:hypothetical protein
MMGDVGVSASAVRRWCRDPDVKVGRINISRVTYLKDEHLGKTYRELGFWYEPKTW